jgi:periplasmic divalent cation tolerance protein
MRKNFIAVFITCSSGREASRIADMIIKKRLAACANIVSKIKSIFRWKGKIVKAKEILIIAKTGRDKFAELEREVKKIHSYEVPEIIAMPITAGSGSYLEWIDKSVN